MANTIVTLPNGQQIVLVDREQMRLVGKKQMTYNPLIRGFVRQPTPPATFDWSRNRTIQFPMLGNDQYGDCYYCAMCHGVQSWSGMAGRPVSFDASAVIRRYLKISGGDNGLDDRTIIPEWKHGIIGPSGPHKILDEVQVDVRDDIAVALAAWAFGGLIWTASLLSTWLSARPGMTWTNDGEPDPYAGHAMWISGKTSVGLQVETWGFDSPVTVTAAGVRAADSEFLACFSMEMFDAKGFAPCGLHYLDLVPLWQSMGGSSLPPSPFPEPASELLTYIP